MGYKVNAQNVLRQGIWKKRLQGIAIAVAFLFIIEFFLIYNFLSYQSLNLTDEKNIFILFIDSISIILTKESFSLKITGAVLKQMVQIFFSIYWVNLLIFIFGILNLDKFSNYRGVEHGSSDWATKRDKKKFSNSENTIPVADKLYIDPNNNNLKNLHELVIGDTGAGKSFTKAIPDILQLYGNYIISDVKGTLFRQLYKVLKEEGYDIKVLNLKDLKYSNTFNPLAYVKTDDEIIDLVETFKVNSRDDFASKGDQFWEDTMVMLLTSVITYLVKTEGEEKTFVRVVDLISSLKVVKGKILASCELEMLMNTLEAKEPMNAAVLLYKQFKQAAGETLSSVLISTTSRLRIWTIEDVRILTNTDEMNIDNFMKKKTAIFLVVKPNNSTYKVISSMYLSVLFNRLFDLAEKKYGGKLPQLLSLELDEFANLGKINNFDTVLTTARSYGIRIVPYIQSIQQLEKLYDKADKTIISNCSIFNYLGTEDPDTRKKIVERLGKTTIEESNTSVNFGGKQGGGNKSNRGLARELLTIDELGRIDTSPKGKSIVLIDGKPYFCDKFKTEKHPLFDSIGNDIKDSEGYKNNTNIEKVYKRKYNTHKKEYDKYCNKHSETTSFVIIDNNSCPVDTETGEVLEQVQDVSQEDFEKELGMDMDLLTPANEPEVNKEERNDTINKFKLINR